MKISIMIFMQPLNYTPIDFNFTPLDENWFRYHEVAEHEPEAEVRPFVSSRQELVKVDGDMQEMGIVPSGTPTYVNYKKIKLPLTDVEIHQGLHAPITASLRWLAEQCVYLLKRAGGQVLSYKL